jgi:hypothetical protein
MTEKVIDITEIVRTDEKHEEIRLSYWDLEQALQQYLLQNGQITNADEVAGMSVEPSDDDPMPTVILTILKETA